MDEDELGGAEEEHKNSNNPLQQLSMSSFSGSQVGIDPDQSRKINNL